jgi:hypothetical protein
LVDRREEGKKIEEKRQKKREMRGFLFGNVVGRYIFLRSPYRGYVYSCQDQNFGMIIFWGPKGPSSRKAGQWEK